MILLSLVHYLAFKFNYLGLLIFSRTPNFSFLATRHLEFFFLTINFRGPKRLAFSLTIQIHLCIFLSSIHNSTS
jgi:hypothetical protein